MNIIEFFDEPVGPHGKIPTFFEQKENNKIFICHRLTEKAFLNEDGITLQEALREYVAIGFIQYMPLQN